MPVDQTSKFCKRCNKYALHARPGTNHLIHALVTIFLCGFWLPVWILASLKVGGWKCQTCGYGGSNIIRTGVAATAIVLAVGAVVTVFSVVGDLAEQSAKYATQPAPQPFTQPSSEPKHYELVRMAGKTHFVWVDPQYKYDAKVYEQAISDFGGDATFCFIHFWDDRKAVPERFPMTDEQVEAQVAQYERNRTTGHEQFFYMRNGDMVEPFGNRPSTTPTPSQEPIATSPQEQIPTPSPEPAPTVAEEQSAEPKLAESEFRTWTSSLGKHRTEARFASMTGGKVKLIKRDGSAVQVPLEKLSDADQEWIANRRK